MLRDAAVFTLCHVVYGSALHSFSTQAQAMISPLTLDQTIPYILAHTSLPFLDAHWHSLISHIQ